MNKFTKVIYDVFLTETKYLNICDFFKTKNEGGIFGYVDHFELMDFDIKIRKSINKKLTCCELTKDVAEKDMIDESEEVDFSHIKQVCERHIVKGEKLLAEKSRTIFFVRDKKNHLRRVSVMFSRGNFDIHINETTFPNRYPVEWSMHTRFFIKSKKTI